MGTISRGRRAKAVTVVDCLAEGVLDSRDALAEPQPAWACGLQRAQPSRVSWGKPNYNGGVHWINAYVTKPSCISGGKRVMFYEQIEALHETPC